jgi:hypothetical protein
MFDGLLSDPQGLSDEELTARLVALEAVQARIEAARVAAIAEWDRRKVWAADGSRSAAARLARETGMAQSTARERVRVAAGLRSAPRVREAFEEGGLSWSKVRSLLAVVNPRTAEAFARDESMLVEQATVLSVEHLAILLRHWERLVDEDGANASADAMRAAAYLDLARSFDGEGFLKGRLDPESLAIVKGELDAIASELLRAERGAATAEGESDAAASLSSPSHRRAQALVEMARRSAANTAAAAAGATVVPARPLVVVHVDVERNEGFSTLTGRLDDGSPVSQDDVRRLCCDAGVMRAVTRGGSVPIDLGRTSRDPSEAQRRFLASIWPTCAYPGCDLPYGWTQLHHIRWWDEHHGPTDLDNLLPLCSHHHHQTHRGTVTIARGDDGVVRFALPDGRVLGSANPTLPELLAPLQQLALAG